MITSIRRISDCIVLDNEKHVGKCKNDQHQHHHERTGVNNCCNNNSDKVCKISEDPHPVEHFDPHKPAADCSIRSN